MKKILLYAAVPFFSSFHITQYSGLYSQNTWSGWPSSLSRAHSRDEKTSSDRRLAQWKSLKNTGQIWPKPRLILRSKLAIFFSPPNNLIVQIDETQKNKNSPEAVAPTKNTHSAKRKAHRQPNRF